MNEDLQEQIDDFQKQLNELKNKVDMLGQRRLNQMDFIPGCVKNRAQGEPNSYIYSGLSAKRPIAGVKLNTTGLGCSIWWSTDTHILSIWDGNVWRTVTLT